jgi:hypothetical protein
MSYIEKSISIFGTELQFLQAFINAITATDSRITCATDIEAQFADDSNTPSFTLSVDGIYTVTFTRNSSLGSDSSYYSVTSSAYSGGSTFSFSNNPYAKDARVTRTWRFSVMANSEDIYLKLARYDAILSSPNKKWLSIRNNAISACAVGTGSTNIMSGDFVSTGGQIYKKVDRLPYTYNASDLTKIEVINSKTFVENSTTNRAFETSKIIDSTIVTADQIISINSTKYYALDSNTLMEV